KSLVGLQTILSTSKYMCVARVESLAPDRPGMVLTIDSDLKGKLSSRRMAVNMQGDAEGKKEEQGKKLFKRLAKDLPVLLFVTERDGDLSAFGFTNGTWFQMLGSRDGEVYRWSFLHFEPYFRRTFKGTTAELQQIVKDFVEKKKAAPPPNEKEEPGIGPEAKQSP